jgi:O-antigen/teichoic acid export membrane protein
MDAVNRVSFPTLSRLRSERAQFNYTYERIQRMLALFGFLVAWGLGAVAPELVQVVLSDKWRLAVIPLVMLSIAAPIRMLMALQNTVNNAAGVPQASTKILGLTCLVLPLGVFIGARVAGINGAAVSCVVVYTILFFVSTLYTCRVTNRDVPGHLRLILVPLVAGIVMLVVTSALRALLRVHLPTAGLLVVEIASATAAYLGTVHVFGPAVLDDARALLRELLQPEKSVNPGIAS